MSSTGEGLSRTFRNHEVSAVDRSVYTHAVSVSLRIKASIADADIKDELQGNSPGSSISSDNRSGSHAPVGHESYRVSSSAHSQASNNH
ncbi:hypothetical protein J1614_011679 [Plenodomus biglobosus]|nr:hypothetical protein J1614_011679 [Plenodomus biglobosus]